MEILTQRRILGPRLNRLSGRRIFIHARRAAAARIAAGEYDFFNHLWSLAQDREVPVHVVHAAPRNREDATKGGQHLHIFYGGTSLDAPGVLHACPTYLHGFWYCDPMGARQHASIRQADFSPSLIDSTLAEALLARLYAATVAANRSKYDQPARGASPLRTGGIAVFAQEPINATEGQFNVAMEPLLRAVIEANAGARPVYIKLHPRQRPELSAVIKGFHAPHEGVEVVDVSVHDLLESCAFTVSQASAAAFEGFLHKKPAILAGVTDFAHNAVTISNADQMADAIAEVEARQFPYAKYLTWFLGEQCLEPKAPNFKHRLAQRIADAGFLDLI